MSDIDKKESEMKGRFKVKNVKVADDVDDVNKSAPAATIVVTTPAVPATTVSPLLTTNTTTTLDLSAEQPPISDAAKDSEVIGRFRVKNVIQSEEGGPINAISDGSPSSKNKLKPGAALVPTLEATTDSCGGAAPSVKKSRFTVISGGGSPTKGAASSALTAELSVSSPRGAVAKLTMNRCDDHSGDKGQPGMADDMCAPSQSVLSANGHSAPAQPRPKRPSSTTNESSAGTAAKQPTNTSATANHSHGHGTGQHSPGSGASVDVVTFRSATPPAGMPAPSAACSAGTPSAPPKSGGGGGKKSRSRFTVKTISVEDDQGHVDASHSAGGIACLSPITMHHFPDVHTAVATHAPEGATDGSTSLVMAQQQNLLRLQQMMEASTQMLTYIQNEMRTLPGGVMPTGGIAPAHTHNHDSHHATTSSRSVKSASLPSISMQQVPQHPPRPPSAGIPVSLSSSHAEDKDNSPGRTQSADSASLVGSVGKPAVASSSLALDGTTGGGVNVPERSTGDRGGGISSNGGGGPACGGSSGREKDKSLGRMSHYLNEMKKELDQAAWQKRESGLESQRLREKCVQLEDKLQAERYKNASLEDRLEKAMSKQKQLQSQLDSMYTMVNQQHQHTAQDHSPHTQVQQQMQQSYQQSYQQHKQQQHSSADGAATMSSPPAVASCAAGGGVSSCSPPNGALVGSTCTLMPPPVGSMPPGPSLVRVRSRDPPDANTAMTYSGTSAGNIPHCTSGVGNGVRNGQQLTTGQFQQKPPSVQKPPPSPAKSDLQMHQSLLQQHKLSSSSTHPNGSHDHSLSYLSAVVGSGSAGGNGTAFSTAVNDLFAAQDAMKTPHSTSGNSGAPSISTSAAQSQSSSSSGAFTGGLDALDALDALPKRKLMAQSVSSNSLIGVAHSTAGSYVAEGMEGSSGRPAVARRHNSSSSINGAAAVDDIDSFIASRAVWGEGDDVISGGRACGSASGAMSISSGSSPFKR